MMAIQIQLLLSRMLQRQLFISEPPVKYEVGTGVNRFHYHHMSLPAECAHLSPHFVVSAPIPPRRIFRQIQISPQNLLTKAPGRYIIYGYAGIV